MAMVLGGGYPAAARKLTPEQRQEILERDNATCQVCGNPGDQVDHIEALTSGLNDPSNLQVLCDACHKKKTRAGFRPIGSREEFQRMLALRERIDAPAPLRACDGPDWSSRWQAIKKERRAETLKANSTPLRDS
jgi:5-methylcytosine-specific restriction protein A